MNSFGISQLQFPLYDVRSVINSRTRFRREVIPDLQRVNNIYLPAGRWPLRGWLLMARGDYNKLNQYSTSFQLNIADPMRPDNVGTLNKLSIVQARCATRGLEEDPDALYLVEITDDRGVINNKWFQAPITAAYNIRAPAYTQAFFPWSMQTASLAWTWSTMLEDVWGKISLNGLLNTWPGLPSNPAGTPEGFWMQGIPVWPTFNDIIEHLGMTLSADLTLNEPYGITEDGAEDEEFNGLEDKYEPNLEDDLEWIDAGAGRVPAAVLVLFRRRNSVYGTEETVRTENIFQWESSPFYSLAINAPVGISTGIGTHHLWSDFTVRYDQDGIPLPDDTATAATIAAERVAQYYDKILSQTTEFMTRTYTGALPFTTGSQVDGVRWYMDHEGDGGWRTQIVRGMFPPWNGIW